MLFDGARNDDIDQAVRSACEARGLRPAKIHGTSLLAYGKSVEFTRYCDKAREWDERMASRRWAAALQHEGQGPQTIADLAEMEILEQLHTLAAGGLLETGKDVAVVARAITSMQRTQLARGEAKRDDEAEQLKATHAKEIAKLQTEITRLRNELDEKTGNAGGVDAGKVADALDEVLGVKK